MTSPASSLAGAFVRSLLNHRAAVAVCLALLVGLHLAWDHFHGGIPTHHLAARGDLPGVSNLWGLLSLPVLAWVTLTLVRRRLQRLPAEAADRESSRVGYRIIAALLFGILVSALWEFGHEAVLQYLILLPLPVALFVPVSRPEHVLGFVLGMSYTFGGVLPILFGLVLATLGASIHYGLRGGTLWLAKRVSGDDRRR